jgi:hypothetical protein
MIAGAGSAPIVPRFAQAGELNLTR